ncbi:hypothetical protein EDB83DRAFT_2314145 [Lactarius deliciosus]|nr:hypothetical protein EDB83DRAFT_2314145 [Lactarius deliciosus]
MTPCPPTRMLTIVAQTMTGPTPTPFTGDRALAQQFLDEFWQFERANLRHVLITRPALRVELALSFIRGPLTDPWKQTVRRGSPGDTGDEELWDEFYDSFCTAWTDDLPVPVPQTPSPLESTDATAVPSPDTDNDFDFEESYASFLNDNAGIFSPRAPTPTPSSSIFDLVRPVEEPVHLSAPTQTLAAPSTAPPPLTATPLSASPPSRPPRSARRSDSPTVPATTHDESYDPPATASDAQRTEEIQVNDLANAPAGGNAELSPRTRTPADEDEDWTLFAPRAPVPAPLTPAAPALINSLAHANGTSEKRKRNCEIEEEDETRPGKRIHVQLARRSVPLPRKHTFVRRLPVVPPPPVGDSNGFPDSDFDFTPPVATPCLPPPCPPRSPRRPYRPRLSSPPLPVVEDDNTLTGGVKTLDSSVFAPDVAVSPSLPPVDKPPPRPPRSPRHPHSPKIASAPLPVVEDDNTLTGGVKTSSSASVWTFPTPTDELPHQTPPATPRKPVLPAPAHDKSPSQAPDLKLPTPTENESPPPRPPRNLRRVYGPLLLTNAFERPRDPDEITPQTPRVLATPQTTSRHRRANAADTTSPAQPTNPVPTRTRDRHTQSTRHAREERHTANIAHANDRIRGWLTRVIYEPPPRNDTRSARTRPPLDPIAEEHTDHALREYGYDYEDARRED